MSLLPDMDSDRDSATRLMPIEWEMMDRNRFFGFSLANAVALRSIMYPLITIKTRLQVSQLIFH